MAYLQGIRFAGGRIGNQSARGIESMNIVKAIGDIISLISLHA